VANMVVNHVMFADDMCVQPNIVDSSVFWIFVVTMLLNMKSPLIVTKHLVNSFCPKKYKQPAPSNIFVNGVHVQFFDHVKYLCCVAK